jgi:hypothetical protein
MQREAVNPFQRGQDLFRQGQIVPTKDPDFRELFDGYVYEFGFTNGLTGRIQRLTAEPYYLAGYTIGEKVRKGTI